MPTIVNKTAPDFCSVYVVSKGKQQSVRPAARPLSNHPTQLWSQGSSLRASRISSAGSEDSRYKMSKKRLKKNWPSFPCHCYIESSSSG